MKNLTKNLFCMFVCLCFNSCVPDKLPKNADSEVLLPAENELIGETGDQNDDVYDKNDNIGN